MLNYIKSELLQSDAQPLDLCDDRNYGSIAGVVSYYFVCDRCGQ